MTNRTECSLWLKLDRKMTWLIIHGQSTMKTKSNYYDQSNWMWFVMKKPDRKMTRLIVERRSTPKTKVNYCDRLENVRFLTKGKHDNNMTDHTCAMMKMKLNCCDWLDRMWSMMKTRQDNNMTDYTGAVYVKNDTKLSRPIRSDVIFDKN